MKKKALKLGKLNVIEADGHFLSSINGGVAPTSLRAVEAEAAIVRGDSEAAKDSLRRTLHPMSDHRGSAEYRLAMACSLLDKFFAERL